METALPDGFKFYRHPRTKIRFVETPDRKLIPNQGSRKHPGPNETDAEIIADFYIWLRRQ